MQSFPDVNLTLGVPFSWNLFYFASLCFVVSGVIFSWKAPSIIKKYKNFNDFMDKDKSGVAIINEAEKNLETNKEKSNYFNHLIRHFGMNSNEKLSGELSIKNAYYDFRLRVMMKLSDTEMANLYSITVGYLDGKFLFFRILVTFFYFLSFSFYGYVALQQSIFVITEFIVA